MILIAIHAFVFFILLFSIFTYRKQNAISRFMFTTIPRKIMNLIPMNIRNQPISALIGKNGPFKHVLIFTYYITYHFILIIYFLLVFPKYRFILQNPEFHYVFTFIIMVIPWIVVLLFQFIDPGEISSKNVDDYLKYYPYDNVIYHPGKCSKLLIPSVPRSRYCPFTEKRIARYDHYCPWVLQPIGERNTSLYLLFLISNFMLLSYLFVICLKYLQWKSKLNIPLHNSFSSFMSLLELLFQQEPRIIQISTTFLILAATLIVIIFKQFYLISKNITSSEVYLYREEQSKNNQPINNIYDRGILLNWFQIIFLNLRCYK